jgi:hypothetical protein
MPHLNRRSFIKSGFPFLSHMGQLGFKGPNRAEKKAKIVFSFKKSSGY